VLKVNQVTILAARLGQEVEPIEKDARTNELAKWLMLLCKQSRKNLNL
jgi:hypothetical protein